MAQPVQGGRALHLPLQVALVAALAGCASAPPPAPEPAAAASHADDKALALAERLVRTFGYDHLPEVAQLNFRYVFRDGDDELFATEHHWDLVNQRDRIVWTDPEGRRFDVVLDVDSGDAYGYVDGREAVGPAQAALTLEARRRFSVDTQYLLVPLRLFDAKRHLIYAGHRDLDGHPVEVLELYPEEVDDPYAPVLRLFVEPSGLRVRRSEVAPGGKPSLARGATWDAYRPVGPLLLPHEHRVDGDAGRRIVLEDVVALRRIDHDQLLPTPAR